MSTKPPAIEPLFESETLEAGVAALGRRLGEEVGAEDPLLVAILGGSVIFLADLVRAIPQPVRFELVQVGYSGGGESSPVLSIEYPIPIDIEGQSVILIKDVVNSGVTEAYLEQQLRDRGARSVRVVALFDMPEERKTDLEVHYSAFVARRQGILVGYGLKHEGRYGNLPFVGRLPEEA